MIDKSLYQNAIVQDYELMRCPLSMEKLVEKENGLVSVKTGNVYRIIDCIPEFASFTIKNNIKEYVQKFWDNCPNESVKSMAQICSTEYFAQTEQDRFDIHTNFDEPFLKEAIGFESIRGKKILEVGCGIGLDAIQFARSGNDMYLIDLSINSVKIALGRFQNEGYCAVPSIADAENLPFFDNSFDIVYSYGVLHHSPNTEKSIVELYRVLKPGGQAIVMLYSKWSANCIFRTSIHNGLIRKELFKGYSLKRILSEWTELQSKTDNSTNPLTQVFSFRQIKKMFNKYTSISLEKHFINRYQMAEARIFLRFISETQKANLHKYLGWNTIIKACK